MTDHYELKLVAALQSEGAAERLPCYWIRGSTDFGAGFDDATNFCRPLRRGWPQKFAAEEPAIDGGWTTDHDVRPYCDSCGVPLAGFLTDYGVNDELDALSDYAAPTWDDCEGWSALLDCMDQMVDDNPRWAEVERIIERAARQRLVELLGERERREA